jgi:hypothetical protein
MTPLEFFKLILPESGYHFLGLLRAGHKGVAHKAFTSLDDMAAAAVKFNRVPNLTVYHALASFKEEFVQVGDKQKYRIASNASHVKAFWADMDCGTDKAAAGKGYEDKTSAAKALLGFCKQTGFPTPMIVDSGNGVHAYWPLSVEIPAEEWRILATQFKSCLAHFGVLADPSRTADVASVLRPVGTHNKKDAENHKEVKVRKESVVSTPAEFMAALSNIVSNFDVICEAVMPVLGPKEKSINDDFLEGLYPQKQYDAEVVRSNCQQVQAMFTGSKGYDHWRGVIGIVKFCDNPMETAHKWSSSTADAGKQYDSHETTQKVQTWNSPPTTCAFFEQHNAGGCAGCKFAGKVTTPLQLGVAVTVQEAEVVTAVIDDEEVAVETPEFPYGYRYDDKARVMLRELPNKDGVIEQHKFSHIRFYPTTRVQQADGTFSLHFRMHLPDGRLRDFDMPMYIALAGGTPLKQELGKYELSVSNNKDAEMHLGAYVRDSVLRLMHTSREMNTMTTFGWRDGMKSFLIGDRLHCEDGSTRRVILGGAAAGLKLALPEPAKSYNGWVDGVDFMYNRPGMEPMQYAVCSAFGSILTPFVGDQYHGIPVALTGSGTGKGKTTCCLAALSAFGNDEELKLNGVKGATANYRWAFMGAMNNIPILVDEITKITAEELGEIMYAASNGRGKGRLRLANGGTEMASKDTWKMSLFLTANSHLAGLLASEKANSEAEAVRFIEIKTDTYTIPELDVVKVGTAIHQIRKDAGAPGVAFVKYVVENQHEVAKLISETAEQLKFGSKVSQSSQYRYYRHHVACTMAAASINKALGLIDFDIDNLFTWAIAHVERMCADVVEFNTVTPEDAFSRMMNDFRPRIIATVGCKSGSKGEIDHSVPTMHQPPVGRYIAPPGPGVNEPLEDRLFLSMSAVRGWCLEQRVDTESVISYVRSEGALISSGERFYLGRGTVNNVAQMRCYCIDMKRLRDAADGVPYLTVVTTQTGKEVSA